MVNYTLGASHLAHNLTRYKTMHGQCYYWSVPNQTTTMPPKKKKEETEDLGAMKAARFGRVKNDLAMGFVGEFCLLLLKVRRRGGIGKAPSAAALSHHSSL